MCEEKLEQTSNETNDNLYVRPDGSYGKIDELKEEFIVQQKIDKTSLADLFKAYLLREIISFETRKQRIFSVREYYALVAECNIYFCMNNIKAKKHGEFRVRYEHLIELGYLHKLELKVRWRPLIVTPKGNEFIKFLEYLLPEPLPKSMKIAHADNAGYQKIDVSQQFQEGNEV